VLFLNRSLRIASHIRAQELMRRLHHPNIVACTGVAASSSTVYIVMELMPMGDLHGYLLTRATKRTPLGVAERGWICYQVRDVDWIWIWFCASRPFVMQLNSFSALSSHC
jgi:serine/threonine protein kinase